MKNFKFAAIATITFIALLFTCGVEDSDGWRALNPERLREPTLNVSRNITAGGNVTVIIGDEEPIVNPENDQGVAYGTHVTISATAADGYEFIGWSGTSESTDAQIVVYMNEDVTVIANFVRTYTVTVDSDGMGASGDGVYKAGDTVTITAGTPPEDYMFINWSSSGASVRFGDANDHITTFVMPANNVTITANFGIIPTYTVTVMNGGTGSTGDGEYKAGETVMITAGTIPVDRLFVNWTSSSDGVDFANADDTLTVFIMPANDVTVWANIEVIPRYTVTYNGNGNTGGTVPTDDTEHLRGSDVTVLGVGNLVRTGYSFVGWNTQADGEGEFYAEGNTFNISSNTTLYARWTDLPTYAVTISRNIGTGASGSGNYWTGAVVHINAGMDPVDYRFVNWTVVSGEATLANANSRITEFTMPSGPVVIRANFELIPTYRVTVNSTGSNSLGGGSYVEGARVTISAGTTPAGQRFRNWTTTSAGVTLANANNATTTFTMPANAVSVTANFEARVTYNGNGGSSTPTDANSPYLVGSTVTVLGAGNLTRIHYEFTGWNTMADGSGTSYEVDDTFEITEDITLFAQWQMLTYTLTTNVSHDGRGTVTPAGTTTHNPETNVTITATPAEGFRFVSWTGTVRDIYSRNTTVSMTTDRTITANFEPLTHRLTINRNPTAGGSVTRNPSGIDGTILYNHATTVTVTATPTSGYRFTGWSGDSTSTESEITIVMLDDQTLTANFELIPINTVTVSSTGTGASGSGRYAEGTRVTITAGRPPENHVFRNWMTTSRGVNFANANNATTTFTMPANAVTVTANFVRVYPVTVSSIGTGAVGSGNYAQGDTVTISAGTPPANHRFRNWTTTSRGVNFANANDATTTFIMLEYPNPSVAATVTVTAHFEILPGTQFNPNITYGRFTDSRDNQTYRTVVMPDGKTWMAENLNYATNSGSWCYDDRLYNCEIYGRLYDWATAMNLSSSCNNGNCASQIQTNHQGICPAGWYLPSDTEWDALFNSISGGWMTAGTKLKSSIGWESGTPPQPSTNDFGFSALPSRSGTDASWWVPSEWEWENYYMGRTRVIRNNNESVSNNTSSQKTIGSSIRCIKAD